MTEWMEISTAPKDGRLILVVTENASSHSGYFTAYWDDFHDAWFYRVQGFVPNPSHWRPLPSPPTPTNDTQSKTLARAV